MTKSRLIEPQHPELSIRQQCELLGLNRSSYYYQPATETALNLTLMWLMDEQYTQRSFYGRRKIQRKPTVGLLHHSDRGSQYASLDYQAHLATHQIAVSMSRTGNCYDNAAMESFWATLKAERTYDQAYQTQSEARTDIFLFIEGFYNPHRRHSALGYLSPDQFERHFYFGV